MEQRRAKQRLRLSINVSLSEADHDHSGVMGDLSEGGLFIASDNPLAVGTTVFVTIPFSETEQVRGNARVKWQRATGEASPGAPAGFGLEWVDLPPGHVESIRAIITRALEKM